MKRGLVTLCLLAALAPHVAGQELLSLARSRELALAKNENVQIAARSIARSEDERAAVRAKFFPSVRASAMGIYLRDNIESELYLPTVSPNPLTGELTPNVLLDPMGQPVIGPDGNPLFSMYAWLPLEVSLQGAYMAGVQADQPIFAGGRIATGSRMAGIGVQMAHENLRLQRINAIAEADQAYWLYVSLREKVKLAQRSVEFFQALEQRVANAYQTGMATGNEMLRVQVSTGSARLNLQKAQSGLALARMSLCRITGLPLDTEIIPTDTVIAIGPLALAPSDPGVLTHRAEYQLMSKNLALEGQRVRLAQAQFLPEVGVSVGYNYIGGIEMNGEALNDGNLSVIASVRIPLFQWGEGVRRVSSARIAREIAELEMGRNLELMHLEVEQARLNLSNAWARIGFAQQAQAQAEENLRQSADGHAVGRVLLNDLMLAQLQWQQARSEVIEAKTDFRIKETAYLRATGQLGNELLQAPQGQ